MFHYSYQNFDILSIVLPFALFFTLLYAMGKFVPGFKDSQRLRVALAVIIALFAVLPSITGKGPDPVNFLFKIQMSFVLSLLCSLVAQMVKNLPAIQETWV